MKQIVATLTAVVVTAAVAVAVVAGAGPPGQLYRRGFLTTAANLLVELNPDWLLEIDAASCKAATYLGHQAYDILLKY
jgi:hypothetical protein